MTAPTNRLMQRRNDAATGEFGNGNTDIVTHCAGLNRHTAKMGWVWRVVEINGRKTVERVDGAAQRRDEWREAA